MSTISETGGFRVERFIVKKFKESVDKWTDRSTCPKGMVDTLERAVVHDFVFGQFNFNNEEIDDVISNFDDGDMKLVIFGRSVCLDPGFISIATRIPRIGGVMLTSWKTSKLEKNEIAKNMWGKCICSREWFKKERCSPCTIQNLDSNCLYIKDILR